MIKVSVMYPSGDGIEFDMDYYLDKHIPIVVEVGGDKLQSVTVDRGISGGAPGSPAPFVAVANLMFDSLADFQAIAGSLGARLGADGPNYTNARPKMQIAEVASPPAEA